MMRVYTYRREASIQESSMNNTAIALKQGQNIGKLTHENVNQFCGLNAPYYLSIFHKLAHQEGRSLNFNVAAFLGGPYWAVARGMWLMFWAGYTVELISLGWLIAGNTAALHKLLASLVILANRLYFGCLANHSYWQAFCSWRVGARSSHIFRPERLLTVSAITIPAAVLGVAGVAQLPFLPKLLTQFPNSQGVSLQTQVIINHAIEWASTQWGPFFDSITASVRWVLDFFERVMLSIPWPAVFALVGLMAWRTGGLRLCILAMLILTYLGVFGYWEKSISTMSLVAASVVICIVFGVPMGIISAKNPRFAKVADPIMDMMQTMPSFVYLLPAIAFFSIGKPPAILATVVFAMPPVIKLTALGIRQVPENVKEAMLAFGATPMQLLVKAELPMAISSVMAGVNQSIMMSLSMVVVGALIGAGGLGFDVLSALQQMDNGAGILAGAAIVACATLLDRLVQGRKKS